MAWDNDKFYGQDVLTGDKPIDELSLSFQKIKTDYEERFQRKPTVAELLYAINIVMKADPERFFSDPDSIHHATIKI
jgi:hypothetical protein